LIQVFACKETLIELKTVFQRPKFKGLLDTPKAEKVITEYLEIVKMVKVDYHFLENVKNVCPDPKDDIFLALSAQVKADYLATLDTKDLLALESWLDTQIVRPGVICELLSDC
jgi:putative PIN family toxin of toxin-antitoxin system